LTAKDFEAAEILSIHISISLSATIDVARLAAADTTAIPVTAFDSRQLSLGMGFLVETAARSAQAGRSMDDIIASLDEQISRTHVFSALDTVEYLRRSGRISFMMAGLASLLHIKPMLRMYEGKPASERVRTSARATQRLIQLLEACVPLERVALVHTHAREKAEALRQRVAHLLPHDEVLSMDITPVIGAHIGPGAVGFACVSAKK
jgi:DegV family protein with EDD domain